MGLKRPKATNNDLELVVEAHNRATRELAQAAADLRTEREMLANLNYEIVSSLMLVSGQGGVLSAEQEHTLHVEAEVARRRDDLRAQMPRHSSRPFSTEETNVNYPRLKP